MPLILSPEQDAYRQEVRAWMNRHVPALDPMRHYDPNHPDFHRSTREWELRLYEAGYLGVNWPVEYGGWGRGMVEFYIVQDELGRAEAPESITVPGRELVGPILLAAGTEAQKARFIPAMLRGEDLWCQGFSEPGAGSDLAAVRTKAVRDGDGWLIDGQKLWTSQAHFATMCILLARTDPDAPKHKGLTLFLLPMDTPGVTVRPIRQINGLSEFNEVFIDGVHIPDSARLGEINRGWNVAIDVLAIERAVTRFDRNARYFRRYERLVERCSEPRGSRGPLIEESHFQIRLADIFTRLSLMRWYNERSVAAMESGEAIGPEFSVRKLIWSELHQALCMLELAVAAELADGVRTPDVDTYLYSRGDTIFAGTTQIQREIIADRVLRLAR